MPLLIAWLILLVGALTVLHWSGTLELARRASAKSDWLEGFGLLMFFITLTLIINALPLLKVVRTSWEVVGMRGDYGPDGRPIPPPGRGWLLFWQIICVSGLLVFLHRLWTSMKDACMTMDRKAPLAVWRILLAMVWTGQVSLFWFGAILGGALGTGALLGRGTFLQPWRMIKAVVFSFPFILLCGLPAMGRLGVWIYANIPRRGNESAG